MPTISGIEIWDTYIKKIFLNAVAFSPLTRFNVAKSIEKIFWRCHSRQSPLPQKLLARQTYNIEKRGGGMSCVLTNRFKKD